MVEAGSGLREGRTEIRECLARLSLMVADGDDAALGIQWTGAGREDRARLPARRRSTHKASRERAPRFIFASMELIHTCYRITDIDRSVAFYEALGFEERGRMPIRDEALNVFMGLPGDGDRLELTYNFGR